MNELKSAVDINEKYIDLFLKKLTAYYGGSLVGKMIGIWGMVSKLEIDEMHETIARIMINKLLEDGCKVIIYDSLAMDDCHHRIGEAVEYVTDMYGATLNVDALLVLAECEKFFLPSWGVIKKSMNYPLIIDGCNMYDKQEMAVMGFQYMNVENR